jgi:hypothetical protein
MSGVALIVGFRTMNIYFFLVCKRSTIFYIQLRFNQTLRFLKFYHIILYSNSVCESLVYLFIILPQEHQKSMTTWEQSCISHQHNHVKITVLNALATVPRAQHTELPSVSLDDFKGHSTGRQLRTDVKQRTINPYGNNVYNII